MNPLTIIEYIDGKAIEFSTGDAFVNITAMCAQYGKVPSRFLQLDSTVAFIQALESVNNGQSVISTTRGVGGGTWVHPDLGLECARWILPMLAVACNRTIRRILAGEQVAAVPALPKDYIGALEALLDSEKKKAAIQLENDTLKPKAEFYDSVTSSEDTFDMAQAANALGIGRNTMMRQLRDAGVLISGGDRHNVPYQRYIDAGYFEVKETVWTNPNDGKAHPNLTPMVTQRGIDFIRRKLNPEAK